MTKTIKKEILKLKKLPHPNGRKAAQLSKKMHKIEKREKKKKAHYMKTNVLGEKLLWFKDNLDCDVDIYTPELTIKIIEEYLGRFDDELEQIKIKHSIGNRKGRQHASREDIINMTISSERDEFKGCGLEIPDLLDPRELKRLREWNGELRFLIQFKLKRYNKSQLEKEAAKVETTDMQHHCKKINKVEKSVEVKEDSNLKPWETENKMELDQ